MQRRIWSAPANWPSLADLLRERCPDIDTADTALEAWMDTAQGTLLHRFARGFERDRKALAAAIATPWSTGPADGEITRLEAIKRSMYDRAAFHLLMQRVLIAAEPHKLRESPESVAGFVGIRSRGR